MISENLDELSPLLRIAFVLREVQSYSTSEAAKKLRSDQEHFEGASLARTPPAQGLGQRLRRI